MTATDTGRQPDWVSPSERDDLRAMIPGDGDRETVAVVEPFTGDAVAEIPACTASDVETAFDRAQAAQGDWADRSLGDRIAVVRRFSRLLLDRQTEIMDVMQVESGKARVDAAEEVMDVVGTGHYYAKTARDHLAPRRRAGALPLLTRTVERHHPRGTVGVISPWNYPFTLAISDALPALIAGNAVVLKPPLETPYTALLGVDLLRDAGLPTDLFQVVPGYGPEVGPTLIDRAEFVCFTGSTETGRTVAEQAGRQLTPTSLELGGKNPLIVLSDADLDAAANGAVNGCFANAGQLCISQERLYVAESVFDAFLKRFVAATDAQNVGPGYGFDRDVGSLASQAQLDKVERLVDDARERGATVQTGGRPRPDLGPWFYEPTVLTDVPADALVARQEAFGPVVTVEPVSSVREAVERANDSDYGLNASVWTGDPERGRALAAHVECGTVSVNDPYPAVWASYGAPMGGMKDSGVGRRHGRTGITKYTDSQSIAVQRGHPVSTSRYVSNRLFARITLGYYRLRTRLGV